MFFNAFSFAVMNGLAPLSINVQFGMGPAEIGVFLTFIGIYQIMMNVVIGPAMINKWGAPATNVFGSIAGGVGILYPSMRLLLPQLLFWIMLSTGWSLMQPSLATSIGAVCHPAKRGAAMGLMMAFMSLGRTIAPFCAGALFESSIFVTEDYAFSQIDGPFGRSARDPTCINATYAAATGCTVPDYEIEFQTSYSLSPYMLGTCMCVFATITVLVFVPMKLPAPSHGPPKGAGGPPGGPPAAGDAKAPADAEAPAPVAAAAP